MRYRNVTVGTGIIAAAVLLFGFYLLRSDSQARQAERPSTALTGFQSSPMVGLRKPCPKVVLIEDGFDLGVLDPEDACRHVFQVRNEGSAPLKLVKTGTSCKCTTSVIQSNEIPPGKTGLIEIGSKTDDVEGAFSHSASFTTNDPDMSSFDLKICGEIRRCIAAKPPSIRLSDLTSNEPVEMSTLIFSEVWNAFTLANVTSSIDALSWEFQPAPPEKLERHNAKSGYVVTFRLPADRSPTGFSGWFEAEAAPQDPFSPQPPRTVRVNLAGAVGSIRAVYGTHVDSRGVVSIGMLRPGEGARVQLLLRVRGDHREIKVEDIQKTPDFMNVTVEAESPETAKKGLYRILIDIPRDAPACNHLSDDQMGTLRVLTDHPEMPQIVELKVAFGVLSR